MLPIMKCVSEVDLLYDWIQALVTDSVVYCKKAYREVLSPLFPHCTHVLCLAHVVNLAAEVFEKYNNFHHVVTLISMIKSRIKMGRKSLS